MISRGVSEGSMRILKARTPPRILVVEDQLMLAMHLATMLEDIGCQVVGPVAQVVTALPMAMREPLDAALLDIYLADEPVQPIAAILARRGVPFAFVSAYSAEKLPPVFRDRPLLRKPFMDAEVETLVSRLLALRMVLGRSEGA
jgi:DNA-binding response OmpR family regulator